MSAFYKRMRKLIFYVIISHETDKTKKKETFQLEQTKQKSEQIYYDSVYFMRIIMRLGTMNYIKRRISVNITTELTRPIH